MKKGQIKAKFPSKFFVKMTKLKFINLLKYLKFAQICPKKALKYTIFVNIQKRPKNGQTILFLANSFKKGQMANLMSSGPQFCVLLPWPMMLSAK